MKREHNEEHIVRILDASAKLGGAMIGAARASLTDVPDADALAVLSIGLEFARGRIMRSIRRACQDDKGYMVEIQRMIEAARLDEEDLLGSE